MIDLALEFLRDHLNASVKDPGSHEADLVNFVEGDKVGDSVGFALGTISELLVKLEEENTLRPADPFARVSVNGERQRVRPDIRLNLYVLFVAHFQDYKTSLQMLSKVVAYFQNHRVFTPDNSPTLSLEIDQLVVELMPVPFSEQNEIWGALRTSYRPSVLYRVRMVVFRDAEPESQPVLKEVQIKPVRVNSPA
jgi:Pvc16 N-terminal domain